MAQTINDRPGIEGRNSQQPSMSGGWAETAKQRPLATAAAVGGAVAAGAFLWSQRDRIGSKISSMSGQSGQSPEKMGGQQHGSSSPISGRSNAPMGAETRSQPDFAGTGTGASATSPRATGGNRGKAQSGQTMSPSRAESRPPSL